MAAPKKNQRFVLVDKDWYARLSQYLQTDESVAMRGEGTNRVLVVPTTGKGLIFKPGVKAKVLDVSTH